MQHNQRTSWSRLTRTAALFAVVAAALNLSVAYGRQKSGEDLARLMQKLSERLSLSPAQSQKVEQSLVAARKSVRAERAKHVATSAEYQASIRTCIQNTDNEIRRSLNTEKQKARFAGLEATVNEQIQSWAMGPQPASSAERSDEGAIGSDVSRWTIRLRDKLALTEVQVHKIRAVLAEAKMDLRQDRYQLNATAAEYQKNIEDRIQEVDRDISGALTDDSQRARWTSLEPGLNAQLQTWASFSTAEATRADKNRRTSKD